MEFAAQKRAVLVPILHQGSVPLVRGRDKHTVAECLLNCNFEGWVDGGGAAVPIKKQGEGEGGMSGWKVGGMSSFAY